MKFKVELEIEILDTEILEVVNGLRSESIVSELLPYTTISEIPEDELLRMLKEINYFEDEIEYYDDLNTIKVTIIRE